MSVSSLFDEMYSGLGVLGFNQGYADLIAVLRDSPKEYDINQADVSTITSDNLVSVSSFNLQFQQPSLSRTRFAGESFDPSNLSIHTASIRATLKMPIFKPTIGWVQPVFANIWDLTSLSNWGTSSSIVGNLISNSTIGSGTSSLVTDNIADFAGLQTPFNVKVIAISGSGEVTETVTVSSVSKGTRTLNLSTPTAYNHTVANSLLYVNPIYNSHAPAREPCFSLYSLREGLLSPCLVDKLTIDAKMGQSLNATVEIATTGILRSSQLDFKTYRNALLTSYSSNPPLQIGSSQFVTITALTPGTGTFGLPSAVGDPLFGGLQSLGLPSVLLTGITLTIDNSLVDVYTTHSMATGDKQYRENRLPFALESSGRTIKGQLHYNAPIEPWALAERLSGPSALNGGGLMIDYGFFKIPLNELAWEPSSSEGDATATQSRTLGFTFVGNISEAMPSLGYSDIV